MSFFLHLDETCVCADIMGVNFVVFSTLPYRELGDFICVCCYDYHYFCLQLSFFLAIIYIDLDFIMIHSNNECIYPFCFTIYLRTYICMYACKSVWTTFVLHLLARNYLHFSLSELLPRCFSIFTIIGYFLFPFLWSPSLLWFFLFIFRNIFSLSFFFFFSLSSSLLDVFLSSLGFSLIF